MIPLDKLSRSHFDIYEIPDTSSRIYNTKSLRLTLVQVTPQHFIPTWDEVDFQKIKALSCVQFVHKHKAQPFNFYPQLCRSDSRFSVSYIFNFVPSWHEVFHPTWDEVVSEHCHFCYLWASCPQGFPTICWEKWIAIHHINNQRQLLPCFHFFVYGKLNFYANCAEVSK